MILRDGRKGFKKVLRFTLAVILILMPMTVAAQTAETQQAQPVQEAPAAPAEQGDYKTGMALFTGEKRFTNGGPPCISCHSAGVGALDGGVLGPNLSQIYAGPKRALLMIGWVNSPGLPVMGPIFSAKNITEAEMEHLRVFFSETARQPVAASKTGSFLGAGAAGFIGIMVFFSIVWSGRYRKRNKGTAHDALWRNYGGKGGGQ
ncbi:MAG: hypothetical protein HZA05_02275 [Nitrospirae bacterium]|nr:hypothetical protein [Nitrospirota bacterium]